jgi:hypothetical protein
MAKLIPAAGSPDREEPEVEEALAGGFFPRTVESHALVGSEVSRALP